MKAANAPFRRGAICLHRLAPAPALEREQAQIAESFGEGRPPGNQRSKIVGRFRIAARLTASKSRSDRGTLLASNDLRLRADSPAVDAGMAMAPYTTGYAGQAPECYEPVTRRMRLSGHSTSIRLEGSFWAVLDRMAAREGVSTPCLVSRLHDEVLDLRGEARNFASLLRCACLVEAASPADVPLADRGPSYALAAE